VVTKDFIMYIDTYVSLCYHLDMDNQIRNENRQSKSPATSTLKVKLRVFCLECGRKKSVSPNAVDPRCSCGSVDLEVL
jgi:hypothetical protein